jgi:hypothetical protein
MAFAPTPLAIIGLVLALSNLQFSEPPPVTDRKLPAQEWDW